MKKNYSILMHIYFDFQLRDFINIISIYLPISYQKKKSSNLNSGLYIYMMYLSSNFCNTTSLSPFVIMLSFAFLLSPWETWSLHHEFLLWFLSWRWISLSSHKPIITINGNDCFWIMQMLNFLGWWKSLSYWIHEFSCFKLLCAFWRWVTILILIDHHVSYNL